MYKFPWKVSVWALISLSSEKVSGSIVYSPSFIFFGT